MMLTKEELNTLAHGWDYEGEVMEKAAVEIHSLRRQVARALRSLEAGQVEEAMRVLRNE